MSQRDYEQVFRSMRWRRVRRWRNRALITLLLMAVGATLAVFTLGLLPTAAIEFLESGQARVVDWIGPSTPVTVTSPTTTFPAPVLTPDPSQTPDPKSEMVPTESASTPAPIAPVQATPSITLQGQLPAEVFEAFHSDFYSGCTEPPFESLGISDTWYGNGPANVRFNPPAGTYFLVAIGDPVEQEWELDSVLDSGRGEKFQSLRLDSLVPNQLTDAQQMCSTGFGIALPSVLRIEASNVGWTVFLIKSHSAEPLTVELTAAISGYYGDCPPLPNLAVLRVAQTWTAAQWNKGGSLKFSGTPPFYFLGVMFEPSESEWDFESTQVSGNWKSAGPRVSSESDESIEFVAICPQSEKLSHLELAATGGNWIVYLITT